MTDAGVQPPVARALALVRRTPFTIAFVAAMLIVGATTGTLTSAASDQLWYPNVATGLPSLQDGRWWTLLTSPFFVDHPFVYLTLLPLVIGGFGWAEWRFGSLRTAGLALAGHIVGVLGAAGILLLLSPSGWPWAARLAGDYDAGASCAALTTLVFAIAALPAPWRLRARIAIGLWVGISVLYLGHLADLEHSVSIVAALLASGWLPAFRHPAGRPSVREWRLIALSAMIAIGAIQLLDLVIPFRGPLGENDPSAGVVDVAIDVVVILLLANGLRRGFRVAWIGALVLAFFNFVGGALAIALIPLLLEFDLIDSEGEIIALVVAPGVLWIALVVLLIAARGAFTVPLRRSRRSLGARGLSRDELIERLQTSGGGTISWMTTWDGNRRIAAGPEGAGAVAYQDHAGVAIGLGDPVAPPGEMGAVLAEFARTTERAGLTPCVFSTSREVDAVRPEGWRSVIVAEDTLVDLPELQFTGKAWGAVRTAINRAKREGIEFQLIRLSEAPWGVLAQVRAISEQWSGDKGLPEMRFTLGTVEEALDPEVWVGIAVDEGGNLHGVTSWLPVFGPAGEDGTPRVVGWTLDLMRRRDGGFGPVMEFLIASSAQRFAEQGYEFVSLSGAPLVRPEDSEAGPVDQVLERIGGLIEPLYGFKSLHRFKQKFNPRSEPLFLLYRDEGDLPRIGIALTRAYLPDASLRDLAASAAAIQPASSPKDRPAKETAS